jgi:hypothetical protein
MSNEDLIPPGPKQGGGEKRTDDKSTDEGKDKRAQQIKPLQRNKIPV